MISSQITFFGCTLEEELRCDKMRETKKILFRNTLMGQHTGMKRIIGDLSAWAVTN